MKAIVYTSKTGTTEWYAESLGKETSLPVYTLERGKKTLKKEDEVIYLGYIRADNIMGLNDALSSFTPLIIIGVGMTGTGKRVEEVRKANNLPSSTPLFTLQGGYLPSRLKGFEKLLIKMIAKSQRKKLEAKTERNKEEEDTLSLIKNEETRTDMKNLAPVLECYEKLMGKKK